MDVRRLNVREKIDRIEAEIVAEWDERARQSVADAIERQALARERQLPRPLLQRLLRWLMGAHA